MQMVETGSDAGSLLEVLFEAVLKSSISLQILPVLVCQEDIYMYIGCAQQQK